MLWASIQKTLRKMNHCFSYVIYVAKAFRFCLHSQGLITNEVLILKILVVEDNVEISEALGFFCSARKDINCQAADTGREGLDRIRKEDFDLILLDLAMHDFRTGRDQIAETTGIN